MPFWFDDALADKPETGETAVDGCAVRWRAWGPENAPGVLLIHGGAAHARWWDHIAPLLASAYRVTAVDLSGHGDSDWRDRYGLERWADEALAVAEQVYGSRAPVFVGHSMGGYVTISAAARHGGSLAGAVLVDSPVRRADPESQEGRSGHMFRQPKHYPDLAAAVEHFHLVPPQPAPPAYVRDYIARTSLRCVQDGSWTWKFDPAVFQRRDDPDPAEGAKLLEAVACPVAVCYGQRSIIVDADVNAHMDERLGGRAPFVEIPDAHHHLILDQPLAFVAGLRAILAGWGHAQRPGQGPAD